MQKTVPGRTLIESEAATEAWAVPGALKKLSAGNGIRLSTFRGSLVLLLPVLLVRSFPLRRETQRSRSC